MILFIASMLVAASVAGVFTQTVGELSNAIDDQGLQVSQDVRTDVEIISDSGAGGIYDADGNQNITIHLKNTGTETLAAESRAINVFVDGRFETEVGVTLLADGTTWRPGTVLRADINRTANPLTSGEDHRVKVIVNGDEEIFEFRT